MHRLRLSLLVTFALTALTRPCAAQPVRPVGARPAHSGVWTGFGTTDGAVLAMTTGPDGRVYAGGDFQTLAGTAARQVAVWDGSAWAALGTGVEGNQGVYALGTAPGGVVYAVTGDNRILRWDGTAWATFGNAPIGLNELYAVRVGADGSVYVGGRDYAERRGIVRWDGTAWVGVGSGLRGNVWCMTVGPDGHLYVGGEFIRRPGDSTSGSVARWDGSGWTVIGATNPGGEVPVLSLAFAPNGDLYAGGYFASMGGVAARNVARWDGSAWSGLGGSIGVPSQVLALHVTLDGSLYAGGVAYSGSVTDRFVQWTGSAWEPLGIFEQGAGVYGIAKDVNGDLIVAGTFRQPGGVLSPNVARYTPGAVASEPVVGMERLILTVAPNPARGAATVTVAHPAGAVTVELLDALGRRVALLTDGDAAAGTRTLALPLGRLAPGAYVVRVTAGRETITRPLVVVR